jgi:hypothetical protein
MTWRDVRDVTSVTWRDVLVDLHDVEADAAVRLVRVEEVQLRERALAGH